MLKPTGKLLLLLNKSLISVINESVDNWLKQLLAPISFRFSL